MIQAQHNEDKKGWGEGGRREAAGWREENGGAASSFLSSHKFQVYLNRGWWSGVENRMGDFLQTFPLSLSMNLAREKTKLQSELLQAEL